jgi:putative phage-type endonuclease
VKKINLEQGSEEWLEFRKGKVGCSDAPVIMGLCPYGKTPLKLWMEKQDMAKPTFVNAAMRKGIELEPQARTMFNQYMGEEFTPITVQSDKHDWMMASLDGISENNDSLVEIKCVGKNSFLDVKEKKMRTDWYCQIQHALEASGLDIGYLWVYCEELDDYYFAQVPRNTTYIEEMLLKEQDFVFSLAKGMPPEETCPIPECEDEEGVKVMDELIKIKKKIQGYKKIEAELSETLKRMANGKSMKFGEYILQKQVRKGTINYKEIAALQSVNLEDYRGDDIEVWKVV